MSYTEKLVQIDELKRKIDSHGKLSAEVLQKVNYKFRLEWNYTSNRMEGNSLTKSETRSVMAGNIYVRGKSLKDIAEIQGHDKVVTDLLKMSRNDLTISEARIKEIHKTIMHEDDEAKKNMRGLWKTYNNYVLKENGEKFYFTDFSEVPGRMHDLVNRVNAESEKIKRKTPDAIHPVLLASIFHLEYIGIHPFYDGNGRTARIFTNIVLIANGFPPVYIKKLDEQPYYAMLDDIQRNGAPPNQFHSFICDLVIRSQNIVLDAIQGKDIEEDDDIDKEIALWKKGLHGADDDSSPSYRSDEMVYFVYEDSLLPLFNNFVAKYKLFESLFERMETFGMVNGQGSNTPGFIDNEMQRFYNSLGGFMDPGGLPPEPLQPNFYMMRLQVELRGFKMNPYDVFDHVPYIEARFEPYTWTLEGTGITRLVKKYNEMLTEDEIMAIVRASVRHTKEYIDNRIKNNPGT